MPVGSAVNVTCGPPSAFYCRMAGPSGETSRRAGQCWTYVKSVGSQHLDAWTCWSATTESAAEMRYTVRLHTYRGAHTDGRLRRDPFQLGRRELKTRTTSMLLSSTSFSNEPVKRLFRGRPTICYRARLAIFNTNDVTYRHYILCWTR